MRSFTIDAARSLVVAGQSSVTNFAGPGRKVPFIANNTVVIVLSSGDLGGDAVLKLEGREDSTGAFSDLLDVDGNVVNLAIIGTEYFTVVLPQEVRSDVAETTGAGTASITVLGN